MEDKKMRYEKPEITICKFSAEDIITASGGAPAMIKDLTGNDYTYSAAIDVNKVISDTQN